MLFFFFFFSPPVIYQLVTYDLLTWSVWTRKMSTTRMTFVVLCVAGILHMAHFYDGAYEILAVEGINDYSNSLSLVGIELIFCSVLFARGLDVKKKKKRRRGLY